MQATIENRVLSIRFASGTPDPLFTLMAFSPRERLHGARQGGQTGGKRFPKT